MWNVEVICYAMWTIVFCDMIVDVWFFLRYGLIMLCYVKWIDILVLWTSTKTCVWPFKLSNSAFSSILPSILIFMCFFTRCDLTIITCTFKLPTFQCNLWNKILVSEAAWMCGSTRECCRMVDVCKIRGSCIYVNIVYSMYRIIFYTRKWNNKI